MHTHSLTHKLTQKTKAAPAQTTPARRTPSLSFNSIHASVHGMTLTPAAVTAESVAPSSTLTPGVAMSEPTLEENDGEAIPPVPERWGGRLELGSSYGYGWGRVTVTFTVGLGSGSGFGARVAFHPFANGAAFANSTHTSTYIHLTRRPRLRPLHCII